MTLSRWLLGLTLTLSIALPAPDAAAMFSIKQASEQRNDVANNNSDADSDVPPPPPDDDVAAADVERQDRAAQSTAIQRGIARDAVVRKVRALEASIVERLEDAADGELPAVAARLGKAMEDADLLEPGTVADIAAAVAASRAAPAAAESSSSSTAAAKAATAAAAPARAEVPRRGKATNLAIAGRDALSRGLPAPTTAPRIPTRLGTPDLGAREVRPGHATLRRLLSQDIHLIPRASDNPHLREVRDALQAADALLPALNEEPVGRMPPELAEALVAAADREGRAADATGRAPDAFVQSLADARFGINLTRLEDGERTDPIERVLALDRLIAAATNAAAEEVPNSPLQRSLQAAAHDAQDDRLRLVGYLLDTARNFPRAFATVRLPESELGAPVSGGLNSAPRPLRYDFATGSVRTAGPATALFKPTEKPTLAKPLRDGGLSATGVAEFPEMPSRLEQRSVATRRVAELLGMGGNVVRMEFAHLDDAAQTFGLLMSRAPGEAGLVERTDFPEARAFLAYTAVLDRITEAEAMVAFLGNPPGGARPPTPLVTADEPGSGSWSQATWGAHVTALENRLLDIPVRNIGTKAAPDLVGILQERAVTDAHLADPELRRQLSNAQWLDLLCGQVDRHMGNLFIDTNGAAPVVTLIDNDLSFGIDNVVYGLDAAASTPDFRLPPKPFTVDAGFKAAFTGLNKTRLREATRGLLTDAEQDALVARFKMLKDYMKSRQVTEVHPREARGFGVSRRWSDAPQLLFRGHDNPDPDPKTGDQYSYYSLLAALPERPRKASRAPGP